MRIGNDSQMIVTNIEYMVNIFWDLLLLRLTKINEHFGSRAAEPHAKFHGRTPKSRVF